uniref:Beta-lactamase domain-containing protein n=1 Tax=Heterorhabditis bacteriophora TaxID=37862 RepID=A0A1I7X9P5_HETBA
MTGGRADPRFYKLEQIFRKNFELGLESAGASFAVYLNGELVVNLWGGMADVVRSQYWTEHSVSVLFSTTKSLSACVLAYVMDREGVSYEEKVSKYWPEFAKHGKENTTILQVTLHQVNAMYSAGLPYTTEVIHREDVTDWRRMSKYFENAIPIWTPGKKTGYHALTIGFLIDQIVRRIDFKRRGVNQILNEDLVKKFGIEDLSIGLKSCSENYRVARLRTPTEEEKAEEGRRNPLVLQRYEAGQNIYNKRLYETWPWITTDDYNLLENQLLAMPSNMGIGNAQSLAKFHSLLAEQRILSPSYYEIFSKPIIEENFDIVMGYPETKGYGFQFTKNPKVSITLAMDEWIFGHSGYGGQNVRVDIKNHLAYAYVCNGLKIADADMVETWKRLVDTLYQII